MSATGTVALGALIVAFVALTVAAATYVMWCRCPLGEVDGILAFVVAFALCVCITATVVAAGAGILRAYVWMMTEVER